MKKGQNYKHLLFCWW